MLAHLNTPRQPGESEAWARLSDTVRTALPIEEIDAVWIFQPIRRDPQEFGTAIVSRVEGDRRRIYTARYAHTLKGKQRGAFEADLTEVGSGPIEALDELLAMVPRRSDETEPPTPVALDLWFPPGTTDVTDAAGEE